MPADNKRFGEIGVKVITRTSACLLTVSDNPNGVQVRPQLRQAAGTLSASERERRRESVTKRIARNFRVF